MIISSFSGEHRFLSNFYSSPVTAPDRTVYPTVEHAFQAAKTLDTYQRAAIRQLATPGEAKRAGRTIALRSDWDQVKKRIMLELILVKFTKDPELKEALRATAGSPLREGNTWHDNYWGDCTCGRKACEEEGLNALGKILMSVRFVLE